MCTTNCYVTITNKVALRGMYFFFQNDRKRFVFTLHSISICIDLCHVCEVINPEVEIAGQLPKHFQNGTMIFYNLDLLFVLYHQHLQI